jgi:4-hydroxybenzoate polyprenyltransferase
MNPAGSWLALVRFEEYGPLFLLCGVAGAIYAGAALSWELTGVLAFIGLFSASAFVLNDIVDWRDDSLSTDPRNPISRGKVKMSSAAGLFVLLGAGSLGALYFAAPWAMATSLLVYGLYWGYSWGPRFKSMPFVDVVVHGSVPALFVLMGYSVGGTPSAGAWLLAGVVFSLAAMSGLLQEVRDIDKDAIRGGTTATRVGAPNALLLSEGLLGLGTVLFAAAALGGFFPLPMVLIAPAGFLLLGPIRKARAGDLAASDAIKQVRTIGSFLSLLVLLLYSLLHLLL